MNLLMLARFKAHKPGDVVEISDAAQADWLVSRQYAQPHQAEAAPKPRKGKK